VNGIAHFALRKVACLSPLMQSGFDKSFGWFSIERRAEDKEHSKPLKQGIFSSTKYTILCCGTA